MSEGYVENDQLFAGIEPPGSFDPGLVSKSKDEYGQGGARIRDVGVFASGVGRVNVLRPGFRYFYSYTVDFTEDVEDVAFGMAVKTLTGLEIVGGSTYGVAQIPSIAAGTTRHVAYAFTCNFGPGTYFTNAGVSARIGNFERTHLHRILDAIAFRIDPLEEREATAGIVWIDGEFIPLSRPIGR